MIHNGGGVPNPGNDLKDGELLNLLKQLEASPNLTQRELSSMLGISLGMARSMLPVLTWRGRLRKRKELI